MGGARKCFRLVGHDCNFSKAIVLIGFNYLLAKFLNFTGFQIRERKGYALLSLTLFRVLTQL